MHGAGEPLPLIAVATAALAGLAAARRCSGAGGAPWLACVAFAAAALGIGIGSARVAAIDAGALELGRQGRVTVSGWVTAVPRRTRGQVAIRVETPDGRLMVAAPEPVGELDVGEGIAATGTVRRAADWERGYLERLGIRAVLEAGAIERVAPRRGGLAGVLDAIRSRAEAALTAGTPEATANLLRGFVLGQDDLIDERTTEEFKRSGLAHLLAVSGQNVVLLALLAAAVMALLGVPIRARLVTIGVLIGVYVLVTGAGPSIQRAGVMGAAGIVAALADRPRSRWYVLLLAASVTLGLDPRAAGDIGWQLSFAAVAGILALSRPLARLLAGARPGRARRALAEAAALTTAATIATAPLMSLHFGTVSVVSLPANLLAVVAEAPVMWLGMLAAAAGQVPGLPVEPISWLAGMLAAYIAQVAAWFAAPAWAQLELGLAGLPALIAVYAALAAGAVLALAWARRRRSLGVRGRGLAPASLLLVVPAALVVLAPGAPSGDADPDSSRLTATVLDVGQGDAILLQPAAGEPVLIDAGPADADVPARLAELGIDRLAALVVTHPDSDHSGGAFDVLSAVAVDHLGFARAPPGLAGSARSLGVEAQRLGEGSRLRSGCLRLRVLWPPPRVAREPDAAAEPNRLSLIALARCGGFRMLLTGDAEAELAPVHPGAVDVLKVAHHGSEDAGLEALLAEAEPELAVISVGADNPYGHPAPATLAALAHARVPVLRTDVDGDVAIGVGEGEWAVVER